MIDYDMLIGTIFVLLLTMIIGGVILLYPLTRKLGQLLEFKMQERRPAGAAEPAALDELSARLAALEEQLGLLSERQHFVDELLAGREAPDRLAAGKRASD
jgi:hypothetical protein